MYILYVSEYIIYNNYVCIYLLYIFIYHRHVYEYILYISIYYTQVFLNIYYICNISIEREFLYTKLIKCFICTEEEVSRLKNGIKT